MRRLTKAEREAATIVLGMAVSVAGAGISLAKKHTRPLAERASAYFGEKSEADVSSGNDTVTAAAEEEIQRVLQMRQRRQAQGWKQSGKHRVRWAR